MSGPARPESVMMMLKIWMPLPIIHIMKHMKPTWRAGAVAADHSAWRAATRGSGARDRRRNVVRRGSGRAL